MNPNLTCGECLLYNKEEGLCGVTVLHQGEYVQIGVKPTDRCHWQELGIEVQELRYKRAREGSGSAKADKRN